VGSKCSSSLELWLNLVVKMELRKNQSWIASIGGVTESGKTRPDAIHRVLKAWVKATDPDLFFLSTPIKGVRKELVRSKEPI